MCPPIFQFKNIVIVSRLDQIDFTLYIKNHWAQSFKILLRCFAQEKLTNEWLEQHVLYSRNTALFSYIA